MPLELLRHQPDANTNWDVTSDSIALGLAQRLNAERLVVLKAIGINQFKPDNSNLSLFMQRIARAHANCIEGLPIFGGLLLVAIATGQTSITDPLAYFLLAARIMQSSVHLISLSTTAVTIRAAFFAIQMAIGAYWAIRLLFALG